MEWSGKDQGGIARQWRAEHFIRDKVAHVAGRKMWEVEGWRKRSS